MERLDACERAGGVTPSAEDATDLLGPQGNVLLHYAPGLLYQPDIELGGMPNSSHAAGLLPHTPTATLRDGAPQCLSRRSSPPAQAPAHVPAPAASGLAPGAAGGSSSDVLAILGAHALALYLLYSCWRMPAQVRASAALHCFAALGNMVSCSQPSQRACCCCTCPSKGKNNVQASLQPACTRRGRAATCLRGRCCMSWWSPRPQRSSQPRSCAEMRGTRGGCTGRRSCSCWWQWRLSRSRCLRCVSRTQWGCWARARGQGHGRAGALLGPCSLTGSWRRWGALLRPDRTALRPAPVAVAPGAGCGACAPSTGAEGPGCEVT